MACSQQVPLLWTAWDPWHSCNSLTCRKDSFRGLQVKACLTLTPICLTSLWVYLKINNIRLSIHLPTILNIPTKLKLTIRVPPTIITRLGVGSKMEDNKRWAAMEPSKSTVGQKKSLWKLVLFWTMRRQVRDWQASSPQSKRELI